MSFIPLGPTGANYAALVGDQFTLFSGFTLNVNGIVGTYSGRPNLNNPFPSPPIVVDNADARAGLGEAQATYNSISGLLVDETIGGNVAGTFTIGFPQVGAPHTPFNEPNIWVVDFTNSFSTINSISLVGNGNPTTFIFINTFYPDAEIITSASGLTMSFGNGAKPSLTYWSMPTTGSFLLGGPEATTIDFIGTVLSPTVININDGSLGTVTVTGGVLNSNIDGTINISSTVNLVSQAAAASGGDPHCVCLDGSRLDIYEPGFYRMFSYVTPDESIVVNAEVSRTEREHVDYYSRVWVKTSRGTSVGVGAQNEYMIRFENNKLIVEDLMNNNKKSSPLNRWEKIYTTKDKIKITFIVESQYNSVALLTSAPTEAKHYSGAFAGSIIRISDIKDESKTKIKLISSSYYNHNALMCGSSSPHIITLNEKKLVCPKGMYRLLQWDTGLINVELDDNSLLRKLFIYFEDVGGVGTNAVWTWEGDFWNLECLHNFAPIRKSFSMYEKQFVSPYYTMLLRIQVNGSVSVAVNGTPETFDGLMMNRVISVGDLFDKTLCASELRESVSNSSKISKQEDLSEDKYSNTFSIYERVVEPHLIHKLAERLKIR